MLEILFIVLIVLFFIVAGLLLLIVLMQDEQGDTMGGIFGGSSNIVGPRKGNVITKTTGILAIVFFVAVFALLAGYSQPSIETTPQAAIEQKASAYLGESWLETKLNQDGMKIEDEKQPLSIPDLESLDLEGLDLQFPDGGIETGEDTVDSSSNSLSSDENMGTVDLDLGGFDLNNPDAVQ